MGNYSTPRDFKPAQTAYAGFKYVLFQLRLSIATLRDRKDNTDATHDLAPPARLRYRVHGSLNKSSYLDVGRTVAQNIQDLCRVAARDFDSFTDILDFGSGCGRVIQNFRDRSSLCTLYATDIDPDLVSWGESNIRGIQWSINRCQPPLPFNGSAFDLIYGVSVFTHLDEDLQRVWLRELQRVARPEATLILTVLGEYAIGMLDSSYRDELRERGFLFISGPKGRFKLDGLPDFYQTAYHTKEYIYHEWSTYFDIVDYIERGINNHQDAVLLRKPLNRS